MSINKEILEFIDDSNFDEEIKIFLKQGLDIEEQRDLVKKEVNKNSAFFNKYDKIISKLVRE
ncbi:MAG: hypothetical protein E7Z80_06805 [Methanobrevibacter thaueri]|jgi:hypothetical protein|nr:hypothetical protein [Methanobrevibacter thaueri]